ncbi:MAG: DUF4293 domain-containing protein [Chlorobium sp.]
MLARIQNLYLLIVALLAIGSMFPPFWSFNTDHLLLISDSGPSLITGTAYSLASSAGRIFSPLTAIVSIAAIFLFKQRELQSKLIMLAMLLFLGDLFAGLTAAHFVNEHFKSLGTMATHHPEWGFVILLPEPLLLLLALKGVKTDEKIANAYKRL